MNIKEEFNMTKNTAKTKKTTQPKPTVRTIDQLSFARTIAQKYNLKITEVMQIIEEEQKLTMEYVKLGYKVIKKNYITIEGRKYPQKKGWVSPLNGKTYDIAPRTRVLVRVGSGFQQYIDDRKMPERICRFVDSDTSNSAAK